MSNFEKNKDNQNDNDNKSDKNIPMEGSLLEGEERELRKYDDWHAHRAEKNRELNAEYRETELHGVVGKEIHDVLMQEQKQREHQDQNIDKDNQNN